MTLSIGGLRAAGGGHAVHGDDGPIAMRAQPFLEGEGSDLGARPAYAEEHGHRAVSVTRSGADMHRLGYRNRNVAQLPPSPEIDVQNTRAVSFDDDEFERPQEVIAATRDVQNGWLVAFIVVARWTGASERVTRS